MEVIRRVEEVNTKIPYGPTSTDELRTKLEKLNEEVQVVQQRALGRDKALSKVVDNMHHVQMWAETADKRLRDAESLGGRHGALIPSLRDLSGVLEDWTSKQAHKESLRQQSILRILKLEHPAFHPRRCGYSGSGSPKSY